MSDTRTLASALDNGVLWLAGALIGGGGASVMALGMLLRSGQSLTSRMIVGTVLHSVIWGMVVFLLLFEQPGMGLPFILGLSMLSGTGAASLLSMVMILVRKRIGLNVTIQNAAADAAPPEA